MPKVNPDILRWARETAGLTLDEASKKLQISDKKGVTASERLAALEAGEDQPTRPLLVKMAKQYRRPLLVFYLSAPPPKGNRGQDFRTLPDKHPQLSYALVDALIRDVQSRQSIIRAVLEDEDEDFPLPFVGSMKISDGVPAVLKSIKKELDIDIADYRNQPTNNDAFAFLRAKVESIGIFVLLIGNLGSHHTAISLDAFRGFAIADKVAPFIVINDQDSKAAWSFTLIHELAHIWLGQTGISNLNSNKEVEKFCNEVAGQFFLPKEELLQIDINSIDDFDDIKKTVSEFAQTKNISSSMIAYSLLLAGIINHKTWSRLDKAYRELWLDRKEEQRSKARKQKSGPDYYVVRRHRIGANLITLVQRMMSAGAITTVKAGKVLGVKAKNVYKLTSANSPSNSGQSA